MPVKLRSSDLETATARLKLDARKTPYRIRVANGVALAYRRTEASFGTWSAIVADGNGAGKEQLKKFGEADDREAANGSSVLSFDQAMTRARLLARGEDDAAEQNQSIVTLDAALTSYGAMLLASGRRVYNAQRPRRHLSRMLLAKPVTLISEADLKDWRDGLLKKGLAPSTVNRTITTVLAALTLADKTRVHIWRAGLKALPDATEANNVIIEDEATAQAWVAAAYAHDHQLGLLTHVLGESGARPSQAVRLKVRDLISDPKTPRLSMPKSGKGGTRNPGQRKAERYPVSISSGLAALLKAAAKGRPSNAPLLLRKNGKQWSESDPSNDYRDDVRRVVKSIGLDPDVFGMYAFRHTSITAKLLKGTHTAIVAKCHDTSEAMVRKHYSASILDHTDHITRATLPSLGPVLEPASNVVKLAG